MVRAEDILGWMLAVSASSAATAVVDQLVPDIRWLHVTLICCVLGALGGFANHLLNIKTGLKPAVPRWECVVPLVQAVVPAAVGGVVVASAAYGIGGGQSVSPWTFFVAGIAGWRTQWAVDLVVSMIDAAARKRGS